VSSENAIFSISSFKCLEGGIDDVCVALETSGKLPNML
jgi:hypothetical protein